MNTCPSENSPANTAEKISYTLLEISNAVHTIPDLEKLFSFVHSALEKLIPVPNFFIALYDRKQKKLNFKYFQDEFDEDVEISKDIDLPNSLTSEVLLTARPIFLKENVLAERAQQNRIIGPVPKIWVGAPLMLNGKARGIICIQHYSDPEHFSHIHFELIVGTASLLAVALERKTLLDTLEAEKQFTNFIKSHSKSFVAVFNAEGIYKSVNDFHEQMGYNPFDLVGTSLFDILHPDDAAPVKKLFAIQRRDRKSDIKGKFRFKDKNGTLKHLSGRFKIVSYRSDIADKIAFVGNTEPELPCNMDKTLQKSQATIDKRIKTVFIIEDEEMVRSTVVKAVNSFGYNILEASDGEDALAVFEAHCKDIDLILLDVILPRISGAHIFKKILEIQPEVKIIITSGHITRRDREEVFSKAFAYMEKPFHMFELKNMLETALTE